MGKQVGFPDFEAWCRDVLHPEDTHPWDFRTPEFYHEYKTKYAIAAMIRPTSILEIGVRFGYGAQSFLYGAPWATYLGLDMDEPSWGPYTGIPRVWAEAKLHERYPRNFINTQKCNTQLMDPGLTSTFELVHVDADHSYEGARRDMHAFWPLCRRVMVIDDYTSIPDVKAAVGDFMSGRTDAVILDTMSLRGSALIVRV